MTAPTIYVWKRIPMLRLLLPFMAGIILQWYLPIAIFYLAFLGLTAFGISLFFLHPPTVRIQFRLSWLGGLAQNILFIVLGCFAVWWATIQNKETWFGHFYQPGQQVLVTLEEPLVEKAASYKTTASVNRIFYKGNWMPAAGTILLYFKKDSAVLKLNYGSQLVLEAPLQPIKNSGNPGSFDYRRYTLFQGITHQAYATPVDYVVMKEQKKNPFQYFLFRSRQGIVNIFKKYIHSDKERGLAEALLIGYKDDLDKTLVQSYTNTGVVHIIAISGLHLALVYGLLMWVTKFMRGRRWQWARLLLVVSALWLFSLLAGGQPSVLRAAVMFTAIAFGTVLNRRTSIYNNLSLAAFLLLCYNPFWLWDVGFQLSFLAVLSLILFFRSVYNWMYVENKALDFIWQLMAASLAAQVLTIPVSIFYFHQFPVLFLVANVLAVPLSSGIVYVEMLLCAVSFIKPLATPIAWVLTEAIQLMNAYVERLNNISFALWNGLSVSGLQTFLLYGIIIGFCYWLMHKSKSGMRLAWLCTFAFLSLRSYHFIKAGQQRKLIVYNVPKHQAIDVIAGRSYAFIGDQVLMQNSFLRNFHLLPSRIQNRAEPVSFNGGKAFRFYQKRVLIIDSSLHVEAASIKPSIDLLILSKNPKLYLSNLNEAYQIRQTVIDGSVPPWKARRWQKDCDSLHIPCYNVVEKGAFVLNL